MSATLPEAGPSAGGAMFSCSGCRTRYPVNSALLDKRLLCSKCGGTTLLAPRSADDCPDSDTDTPVAEDVGRPIAGTCGVCPVCSRAYIVAGVALGLKSRCANCDHVFVVPRRTPLPSEAQHSSLARRNPVGRWVMYASLLGMLMLLTAGRQLFAALSADPTGLCVFILLVFLGALCKSFFDVLYIHRQIRLADTQIQTLWKTNNIARFLKATHASLFRSHIHNLHHIYKLDTQIDQDNLVVLLQSRLLARTKIVDLCSSILVTLGLVGTIIGLISSVAGLGIVMDNVGTEGDALLGGMRETLSGMGVAFYTTLFGAILGGVCLRILGNVVDENVDFLVAHLAELSEVYILPVLRNAARLRETSPDTVTRAALLEADV